MAATTLLDVVQSILSDANSDEISSIGDTVEAAQCAQVVASVYEDVAAEYDIQAVKRLFKLDGDADPTSPCHMRIPQEFHSVARSGGISTPSARSTSLLSHGMGSKTLHI